MQRAPRQLQQPPQFIVIFLAHPVAEDITFDKIISQYAVRPNAELRTPLRFHPVTDRDDDVKAVEFYRLI